MTFEQRLRHAWRVSSGNPAESEHEDGLAVLAIRYAVDRGTSLRFACSAEGRSMMYSTRHIHAAALRLIARYGSAHAVLTPLT